MPPESTTPNRLHQWGKYLLYVICAVIVAVAVFVSVSRTTSGEVKVLVRDISGARSLHTLAVPSGSLSDLEGDANAITTASSRLFREPDGSVITLDTPGVVRYQGSSKGQMSVLIASPTPPLLRTPLAVWAGGALIAWVSPADGSIQVFQKNNFGSYAPIALVTDASPNSIGFTEDGTGLVFAVLREETTDIYLLSIATESVSSVTTLDGLVSIIPTL